MKPLKSRGVVKINCAICAKNAVRELKSLDKITNLAINLNTETIRVYYENKENSEDRNKRSIKVKTRKEQQNQDKEIRINEEKGQDYRTEKLHKNS